MPGQKSSRSKRDRSAASDVEGASAEPTDGGLGVAKADFGSLRNLYDVAEMFYVQRMRNKEIADRLRISPSEVTRLKNKAFEDGIVDVELRIKGTAELRVRENQLIRKFDLQDARVVLDSRTVDVTERIGQEAADYLDRERIIGSGKTIGLGPGSLLSHLAHHLHDTSARIRQLRIYPLVATYTALADGKIAPDPYPCSRSATFIAFEAANRLKGGPNGPESIEVVPVFAKSLSEGKHPFEQVLAEIADAEGLIITGATVVDEQHSAAAILRRLGEACTAGRIEDVPQLQRRGGTVLVSGRFYDVQGVEVSCVAHKYLSALSLEQVKQLNRRRQRKLSHVLVSGAPRRLPAIKAVLAGGTVTHFVTDLGTAMALLE